MAKLVMPGKTLQYIFGHSDVRVTINVYTNLKLVDAKDEMEKLKERVDKKENIISRNEVCQAM